MKKLFVSFLSLLGIPAVFAHCPLCTIGAAAAGGIAASLGLSTTIIGLFIGAFAISTGFWIARLIRRKYIPYQNKIIIALSFITTVLPLIPLLSDYRGLYIPWIGEYGLTYAVNMFLVSSILGGVIIFIAPKLSRIVSNIRKGKMIPYQGIIISITTLTVLGIIFQFVGL